MSPIFSKKVGDCSPTPKPQQDAACRNLSGKQCITNADSEDDSFIKWLDRVYVCVLVGLIIMALSGFIYVIANISFPIPHVESKGIELLSPAPAQQQEPMQ